MLSPPTNACNEMEVLCRFFTIKNKFPAKTKNVIQGSPNPFHLSKFLNVSLAGHPNGDRAPLSQLLNKCTCQEHATGFKGRVIGLASSYLAFGSQKHQRNEEWPKSILNLLPSSSCLHSTQDGSRHVTHNGLLIHNRKSVPFSHTNKVVLSSNQSRISTFRDIFKVKSFKNFKRNSIWVKVSSLYKLTNQTPKSFEGCFISLRIYFLLLLYVYSIMKKLKDTRNFGR